MFVNLLLIVGLLGVAFGSQNSEKRALDLVSKMTLMEKLHMLHGVNYLPGASYVGNIVGNVRLGIPPIKMQDGPQGFRCEPWRGTGDDGTTTAWPSALTVAASWDSDLVHRWAVSMAKEFKDKGANVQLGPGMGIARVPRAGRNFEYLCGEDPFFCSVMAPEVVTGIQSQGIIANAKHWVNNEIEDERFFVSADVSERARFEIYYPPFDASVKAGVLSVMCSYNRINDVYACENANTLSHLRNELNFKGWVMSDWGATHSTVRSFDAGLDQEMPNGVYFNSSILLPALKNGEISMEQVDRKVFNILYSMFEIGLFDNKPVGNPLANVTSDEHNALAREIAAKATVLLKNDDKVLPLTASSFNTASNKENCIGVFGDETTVYGYGSGQVAPPYTITPFQGISAAASGISIPVYYESGSNSTTTEALAAKCKYSIVVVATTSGEGNDRPDLSLGDDQDNLVSTVAKVNADGTIVAVHCPGSVLLPWADSVKSIVLDFLPGQEAGNGLADIIFGKINPSARLPVSMPFTENELYMTQEQYPGVGSPPEATYSEELLVGYRWYQANKISPRYSFGHGLSYTTFKYGNINVQKSLLGKDQSVKVSFDLANTGGVDGDEIPQLYLTFPEVANEPPRQLKGFTKTFLQASQKVRVEFTITSRDMSIWDETSHAWKLVNGNFQVDVGSSSVDLRLSATFTI